MLRCLGGVLVLFLCVVSLASARGFWPPPEVAALVEEFAESEEGGESASSLLDELARLWEHPVNLRRVSAVQMRDLPLIAPGEGEKIERFLQENPDVRTVEAVGIALGMPPARRQLIAIFYTVDSSLPRLDSTLRSRLRGDVTHRFGYRIPLFRAEPERMRRVYGNAVGTPLAMLLRVSASSNDGIAFGVKGVKRAGEPFFYSFSPQGFPYYSAYVQLQGARFSSPKIVLGDFSAEFGAGQTVGSGLTLFRGRNPYDWGKQGAGIKGRLGIGDNSTLRGVALEHQPAPWFFYSLALSAQPLTTRLANENRNAESPARIAAIPVSPQYTKQSEAERHFNTWEFSAIASMQFTFRAFSISYTGIALHYNRAFTTHAASAFRLPLPAQTHMRNGISAYVYLNAFRIWCEATLSSPLQGETQQHVVSCSADAVYSPSYNFSIGAQGYYYPYEASSRYAQGAASVPQNRTGAMLNAQVRVTDKAVVLVGGEFIKFVNPRVIRVIPPISWRLFTEAHYVWSSGSSLEWIYRYHEVQNVRGEATFRNAKLARVHDVRLRGVYQFMDRFMFRTSVRYAYRDGSESGCHNWAITQECRLFFFTRRLSITCGGACGDCRGGGLAFANYEYAPLYSMPIRRLSKQSWRIYGIVDWKFYRGFSFTAKAATSQFWGDSYSKLSELERMRRQMLELIVQVRWKF